MIMNIIKNYIQILFSLFLLGFTHGLLALSIQASQPLKKINSSESLKVILDWYPNPDHAPLLIAQKKGFFAQEKLDVHFIVPGDPSEPVKLVAANKADIAISYQPQLYMHVGQHLPIIRFATLINTPLNCLIADQSKNIHSLKDLKGKTIGLSSPGSDEIELEAMLKSHGLSLKDVKLIYIHYNLIQSLLTHRVDAIIGGMRNIELIELKLRGFPTRVFYPEENGVPLYDELILIGHQKKINDPRFSRFVKALTLATSYLVNHPNESWELFIKNYPDLNNEIYQKAWFETLPRFNLTPTAIDHSRYQNMENFMLSHGAIKISLHLSHYTTEINY